MVLLYNSVMLEHDLGTSYTEPEAGSEVKVVHTTLETLQRHQKEPNGLSLTTAPLTIVTRRLGENSFEHMAVFGLPLSKDELYTFLKRASHDRYNTGIYDVAQDWSLVDKTEFWHTPNPHYGAIKEDGTHASLDEMHQAFKDGWTIFQSHRHDFIDAIRNANPEKSYPVQVPVILNSRYITREELTTNAKEELLKLKGQNPVASVFFSELMQLEASELKDILKQSKTGKKLNKQERAMNPYQLRRKILYRARNVRRFGELFFDSEVWQRIINSHISVNFQAGTLQTDYETLVFYRRRKENEEVTQPEQIPLTISRDFEEDHVTYRAAYKSGNLIYVLNKPQMGEVKPQPSLTPAIHWTVNDGVRQLHTEAIDDHPLIQTALERGVGPREEKSKFDALLGLLMILYLSPEIRKSLPPTMRSPHGVRPQKLGPGQIVSFAPLIRKHLENADLLPILEQAA